MSAERREHKKTDEERLAENIEWLTSTLTDALNNSPKITTEERQGLQKELAEKTNPEEKLSLLLNARLRKFLFYGMELSELQGIYDNCELPYINEKYEDLVFKAMNLQNYISGRIDEQKEKIEDEKTEEKEELTQAQKVEKYIRNAEPGSVAYRAMRDYYTYHDTRKSLHHMTNGKDVNKVALSWMSIIRSTEHKLGTLEALIETKRSDNDVYDRCYTFLLTSFESLDETVAVTKEEYDKLLDLILSKVRPIRRPEYPLEE